MRFPFPALRWLEQPPFSLLNRKSGSISDALLSGAFARWIGVPSQMKFSSSTGKVLEWYDSIQGLTGASTVLEEPISQSLNGRSAIGFFESVTNTTPPIVPASTGSFAFMHSEGTFIGVVRKRQVATSMRLWDNSLGSATSTGSSTFIDTDSFDWRVSSGGADYSINTSNACNVTASHCFAQTIHPTNGWSIWIDAVKTNSGSTTVVTTPAVQNLGLMGMPRASNGFAFDGWVWELVFWNRQLTDNEITQISNNLITYYSVGANDSIIEPNDPFDIFSTDLAIWYAADYALTSSATGHITNWKDRVSGANATGSNTVTELVSGTYGARNRYMPDWSTNMSGTAGADVDGLDCSGPAPSSSFNGAGGIFGAVFKCTGSITALRTAFDSIRAGTSTAGAWLGINASNQIETRVVHDAATFLINVSQSATASYGNYHWAIVRHSLSLDGGDTDWEFYVDGLSNKQSGAYGLDPTAPATLLTLELGGASRNTTTLNLQGPLGDVFFINGTGSANQLNQLSVYLNYLTGS